jgi:hypothetical protein
MGGSPSGVESAAYIIDPATAPPVFSPKGAVYGLPQTVTISDKTKDAVIYYTTDGSKPTTGSTKYTPVGIPVAKPETIKAIATAPGHALSKIAEATYIIE